MDREIVGKIENPPTQVEGFLYRGMKATAAVAFGSLSTPVAFFAMPVCNEQFPARRCSKITHFATA
ncbi:hypothetical protein BRY73_04770 [Ochrobactrum sp. P6BS-III]|nr:hypothetical protein BRY73_04770 [Ochrobactrum sp. P6BS-III]